jgi:hypothetical protein
MYLWKSKSQPGRKTWAVVRADRDYTDSREYRHCWAGPLDRFILDLRDRRYNDAMVRHDYADGRVTRHTPVSLSQHVDDLRRRADQHVAQADEAEL